LNDENTRSCDLRLIGYGRPAASCWSYFAGLQKWRRDSLVWSFEERGVE
jgi:hypothetical protein